MAPPYRWPTSYQAALLHADARADLLDPHSWSLTPPLAFTTEWLPSGWPTLDSPGYLEGNAVLGPDNTTVYNLLRFNSKVCRD